MNNKWMSAPQPHSRSDCFTLPTVLRSRVRPKPRATARSCKAEGQAKLDFTMKDMNGADFKLADQKGKVVLLNFWATWCAPCLAEIPEFVKVYEEKKDKGFVIVGVLTEDPEQNCKAFASAKNMTYPLVHDDTGARRCLRADLRSADIGAHRARWIGVQAALRADVEANSWSARSNHSCSTITDRMLKGFTHARLACGCRSASAKAWRAAPSPSSSKRSPRAASLTLHVRDLPLFDHREALRVPTRLLPPIEEDYEES